MLVVFFKFVFNYFCGALLNKIKMSDFEDSDDYLMSSSSSKDEDELELINIPQKRNENFLGE